MIRAYSLTIIHGDPRARAAAWVPHPTLPASRHPWTFMTLAEIDSHEKKADTNLANMMREFQTNYEAARGSTCEEVLIETCRAFNTHANLLTRKNQLWYQRVHLALGCVDDTTVSIALYGKVRAYLMHGGKLIDIQKSVAPEHARNPRTPVKLFTSLLAGHLHPGDKLLISCPHLFDYFSIERIQSIMKEKTSEDAVHHLTRMLKGLPGNISVAAVVVENVSTPIEETTIHASMTPHQSIVALNSLQARTAQILSPKLRKNFIRPSSSVLPVPPENPSDNTTQRNEIRKNEQIKKIVAAAIRFTAHTKQFLAIRIRAVIYVWRRRPPLQGPTSPIVIEAQKSKPVPMWHLMMRNILARFRRLPRASQYMLIGAILLGLLFVESVISIAHQRIRTQEREIFARRAASIELMLNESEASLIYGDEEKSRNSLLSATETLASLQARGDTEKEQHQRLNERASLLRATVFHARIIEEPEVLLDLARFAKGDVLFSPTGLIGPSGNHLLSFAPDRPDIQIISLLTRTVTLSSPDPSVGEFMPLRATSGTKGTFYLLTHEGIGQFRAEEGDYTSLVTFTHAADIADMAAFGNRLYTLNRTLGSIERYDLGNNGARTSTWLSQGSVTGATAFTIDGSIFVARADGTIQKFTRGIEEPFTVGALDPALRTPSSLAADTKYLFVLEPTEHRVIILNKNGTLKEQITSPRFDRLADIAIDSVRSIIYVLNGTIVYTIPYPL